MTLAAGLWLLDLERYNENWLKRVINEILILILAQCKRLAGWSEQWALCIIVPHGTKSAILDGKRMQEPPKQTDFNQPSVTFLCFGFPSAYLAIQRGRFYTMWQFHAKGPFVASLTSCRLTLLVLSDSKRPFPLSIPDFPSTKIIHVNLSFLKWFYLFFCLLNHQCSFAWLYIKSLHSNFSCLSSNPSFPTPLK